MKRLSNEEGGSYLLSSQSHTYPIVLFSGVLIFFKKKKLDFPFSGKKFLFLKTQWQIDPEEGGLSWSRCQDVASQVGRSFLRASPDGLPQTTSARSLAFCDPAVLRDSELSRPEMPS